MHKKCDLGKMRGREVREVLILPLIGDTAHINMEENNFILMEFNHPSYVIYLFHILC